MSQIGKISIDHSLSFVENLNNNFIANNIDVAEATDIINNLATLTPEKIESLNYATVKFLLTNEFLPAGESKIEEIEMNGGGKI